MAEDKAAREDKTLPASERKLRQARLDGQVARSRDFGHLMVMGLTLMMIVGALGHFSESALSLMADGLRFDADTARSLGAMVERLGAAASQALWIVLPLGAIGMAAGVIAALVPGGLTLSLKPLTPKWERLNPVQGLQRLFSRNHLVDSVKLGAMIAALSGVAAGYLALNFERIVALVRLPVGPSLPVGESVVVLGALFMLLLLALVALIDVPLQFFRHRAELRMTVQEARREHKESEGDPHLRARIRERQRALGRARMMTRIPSADVVVTNPSHYAVALSYRDGEMRAPVVVAKGVDSLAFRIREVAAAHSVPTVELPPLARALYAHVPLEGEVPEALYRAVAQVLAYVYQLKRHLPGMPLPDRPDAALVPADLDPDAPRAAREGAD